MDMNTFCDVIRKPRNGNKSITFIKSAENEVTFTYHEFYYQALAATVLLRKAGLKRGALVVFQIDDVQLFLTYFWGCVLGGFVPVPLAVAANKESDFKLQQVLNLLDDPVLLTEEKIFKKNENLFKAPILSAKDFRTVFTPYFSEEFIASLDPSSVDTHSAAPADTFFIQFSSGSTGTPKGVVLTHANVLFNIRSIIAASKYTSDDKFISWMPLTHDMGMIGNHLNPFVFGMDHYIMPTRLFIRDPRIWIKKVSEHQVSIMSSPNFGYKFLLSRFKPEDGAGLDLEVVRFVYNGAEPISRQLAEDFLRTLAPYGLKGNAMFPVYGLAEASLAVSFPEPGSGLFSLNIDRDTLKEGDQIKVMDDGREGVSFCSVGYPLPGVSVNIMSSEGEVLQEKYIGRVHIKGENVTSGYYKNPDATAAVINPGGWLNTGDLGFFYDGKLYITGREKDVIFVAGQNFYAHDLERIAEQVEEVELGKLAVAGSYNEVKGEDEIIFFLLYKRRDLQVFVSLANKIKERIFSVAGIKVDRIVPVKKIPKTTSGKVQRFKLLKEYQDGEFDVILQQLAEVEDQYWVNAGEKPPSLGRDEIRGIVLKNIVSVTGFRLQDWDANLTDLGVTSLHAPKLQKNLEDNFPFNLPVSLIFDYPTVNKITDYIYSRLVEPAVTSISCSGTSVSAEEQKVAVIGMGLRYPGGINTPEDFWNCLHEQKDLITTIPSGRWDNSLYFHPAYDASGKIVTDNGAFIDDVDMFDPGLFGISPAEARGMDPQQRLLLEVCWRALENAGLNIKALEGSPTGVYVGIASNDYINFCIQEAEQINQYSLTGSLLSTASGRISYVFGFNGPSLSIDTACSSSLVAVHQGVKDLLAGECELAVAGGVNLILSPEGYIGFSRLQALAPDGRCKSFDESADGYGRAEGCGLIVLKRYEDALADNDNILSVILGSKVNHNGRSGGLTVPSGLAQSRLIGQTILKAGLKPRDIDYIEAHGSGTKLGDPQEINALAEIFKKAELDDKKVFIGTAKSNFGHTESAAGITGLLKTLLCLKYGRIPAQLHFKQPNPLIPWRELPFVVPAEEMDWPGEKQWRKAGVSSFGISGTNAHIILGNPPAEVAEGIKKKRSGHLLTFSARDRSGLLRLGKDYLRSLKDTVNDFADVCYTSNLSRSCWGERAAFFAETGEGLLKSLLEYTGPDGGEECGVPAKIAFVCGGEDAWISDTIPDLYNEHPCFQEIYDQCLGLFNKELDLTLSGAESFSRELPTSFMPVVIFALEYSLFRLMESWGIQMDYVTGWGLGQFTAACCAGIFSPEDTVKLIAAAVRFREKMSAEAIMLRVEGDARQVFKMRERFAGKAEIAVYNGPSRYIFAVPSASFPEWQNILQEYPDIKAHRMEGMPPFYSSFGEEAKPVYREILSTVRFNSPVIGFISDVNGRLAETADICKAAYWLDRLTTPLQFPEAVKTLSNINDCFVLEFSAARTDGGTDSCKAWEMVSGNWKTLLPALGKLYVMGKDLDWEAFNRPFDFKKVELPYYPFKKNSYWIKEKEVLPVYGIEWQQAAEVGAVDNHDDIRYIVFSDVARDTGTLLADFSAQRDNLTFVPVSGRVPGAENTLNLEDKDAVQQALGKIISDPGKNWCIVYAAGLGLSVADTGAALRSQAVGAGASLVNLIQVLRNFIPAFNLRLWILTEGAQMDVQDNPAQSVFWGIGRALAAEMPELYGGLIDLDPAKPVLSFRDLDKNFSESAIRRGKKHVPRLKRVKLSSEAGQVFSADSSWLITGGTGALGTRIAGFLGKKGVGEVIITGRKALADEKYNQLRQMAGEGTKVSFYKCDIADTPAVKDLFEKIKKNHPPLAGIVHAAGVLEDSLLITLDKAKLDKVFAAKIAGTWNLHLASLDSDLKAFILFSSAASVLGNPGQANYAAANGFMNAVCEYRKQSGLTGKSICWGPWKGDGMFGGIGTSHLEAGGVRALEPEQAVRMFDKIYRSAECVPVVVDMDWSRYAKGSRRVPEMFMELVPEAGAENKEEVPGYLFRTRLDSVPSHGRYDHLLSFLQETLGRIMGFEDNWREVPVDQSVIELGADSLVAMDFSHKLTQELGVEFPATLVFTYPSLDKIAEYILSELYSRETDNSLSAGAPGDNILDEIENLIGTGND